jgi:hypothetical protein
MTWRIAPVIFLASWSVAAATAEPQAGAPKLDVRQILEKNLTARGGLDAWRKVQTMLWLGHLKSGSSAGMVPFVLQMKRPDKMRFEVTIDNEKSIRAFDGKDGWKVRPPHGGKPQLSPFTPEEVRFALDAPGIDGPLIDHEAKGIAVELDGTDEANGHKAYRLTVKLPSGAIRHVWIDATSFLELRYDRETRGPLGQQGVVLVDYRDYRSIDGLQIPMTIETESPNGRPGDRMVIDRVLLNPPLQESEFSRPWGSAGRPGAFGPGTAPK